MPDNPIASLYPQPPQPNQGMFTGGPQQAIGALSALQNMSIQRQQFQAQQAVGRAFQQGWGPNGFNPQTAGSAIANDPTAAPAAAEGTTRTLTAQGQNIQNATSAIIQETTGNAGLASFLAGWAGKDNLSVNDLNTIRAGAVRYGGRPETFGALNNPRTALAAIKNAQIYGAGAGAGIQPTAGAPGPNLEPTVMPLAQAAQGGQRPVGASATDLADNKSYLTDIGASPNIIRGMRPIAQALPLARQLDNFNFGPGSADINKIQSLLTTLGISGVNATDKDVVRQEVAKKLLAYARSGHPRSDDDLHTLITSNPNLDTMLKPATIKLIQDQMGMDLQDAAAPIIANGWKGYSIHFKPQWYQSTDPRGFGLAAGIYTPEEAAAIESSMKGADRANLNRSLDMARRAKFNGVGQ